MHFKYVFKSFERNGEENEFLEKMRKHFNNLHRSTD